MTTSDRSVTKRPTSDAVGRGTASPSTWGFGDGQAVPWEYAPAPESRDIVKLQARYGLFIGGKEVAPRSGQWFTTIDPATEEPLAEVARAGVEDVDQAVGDRPAGLPPDWGELPGRERAKYLFRIARILQERSREFAVLETLDGGKPIKESRDVDVPLAAAHFWYYAGWADKLEYAFPGRTAAAARRGRPGHPLELPAADAGLEDRAGAGRRQHGRAQAGQRRRRSRRCSSPTSAARRTCRRASSTSSPDRARSASRWSSIPTSTRSPSPARPPSARRSAGPSPARTRR